MPSSSTSPLRGLITLLAALVGVLVMFYAFTEGISAALDGSGSGSILWQVVFLLALIIVIASIVFAIVNFVRKRSRILSAITIVIGLIPIGVVIALAIGANLPAPTR
ncbi:MAG: hypothetical protein JWP85_656 [Rhodoglobus sp.]|nr:hypothetical protein [Rhodoglobus sp.]